MIADEEQERGSAHELPRAADGVSVAERRGLFDERDAFGAGAGGGREGALVSRANDHAELLHARVEDLLDDDLQGGLGEPVAVDEALQGEGPLGLAGGGDDGFFNFHAGCLS